MKVSGFTGSVRHFNATYEADGTFNKKPLYRKLGRHEVYPRTNVAGIYCSNSEWLFAASVDEAKKQKRCSAAIEGSGMELPLGARLTASCWVDEQWQDQTVSVTKDCTAMD
eukprot:COSAG04_NODE_161_length_22014_cov_18.687383_13_plen_111_part_00